MYALADCNNFFVSCERVFRPDLKDKPVVVLSGNDGCVVARSNEVKQLGIKMGVPFYQIQDEVKKYGIVHFSSNFALYGDLSSRIMSLLGKYTPDLQQYSIDEAFLDLSYLNSADEARRLCIDIREQILRGIGIPVSFGISPTKTLCKVAGDYAKHYNGYKGVCCIDTESKRQKALKTYPVSDVWGIGRKSAQKLEAANITTALQFASSPALFAKNMLHKPGLDTWRELNGEPCIPNTDMPEKQTITCSRTFARGVTEKELLEQALTDFCATCARKLREQKSVCRQMAVFAHTSRFQEQMNTIHSTITFSTPTCNTMELTQEMLRTVRKQWHKDTPYKRAGVILLAIEPDKGVQQQLFDPRDRERDRRLQQAIDSVNRQYGRRTVTLAPQMQDERSRQLLDTGTKSPAYTTRLTDIITLHC